MNILTDDHNDCIHLFYGIVFSLFRCDEVNLIYRNKHKNKHFKAAVKDKLSIKIPVYFESEIFFCLGN